MEIKITIDAPGLEGAIHTLAQVLANYNLPVNIEGGQASATIVADKPAKKIEEKKETPKKEEPKQEDPVKEESKQESEEDDKPETQEISLEVVRSKLADFTSGGKANQVKVFEAITRFGVKKLTDVNPSDYKELLELVGIAV